MFVLGVFVDDDSAVKDIQDSLHLLRLPLRQVVLYIEVSLRSNDDVRDTREEAHQRQISNHVKGKELVVQRVQFLHLDQVPHVGVSSKED